MQVAPAQDFLDAVTSYCYRELLANASCCKDAIRSPGVLGADVLREGAAWECTAPPAGNCVDDEVGPRGKDRLWWPEGADCSTPRILYLHGGNWTRFGPMRSSYDVLASKLAKAADALVLVPDFRLVPLGNYTDMLRASLDAWRWLGNHGPGALDCSAAAPVPQFLGGDASGGATALSLLIQLKRGVSADQPGLGPPPAGFFGFSPWTNLACDTPTFYSEAFAKHTDAWGVDNFVGDILHRQVPRSKTRSFRELGLAYVGSKELLQDPIASPFHAAEMELRFLPPIYFAISGTESMAGDSVVLAAKAAHYGVPVAVDIFVGMWHVFPQYAEGCGFGQELWQGVAALMHTGDFIRQIFALMTSHPHRQFAVPDGSSPQTEMYYVHPTGRPPWVPLLPLTLMMEVMATKAVPDSHDGAPAVEQQHPDGMGRRLDDEEDLDEEECTQETVSGAFLAGAAGGALLMVFCLGAGWVYASTKHGLCIRVQPEAGEVTTNLAVKATDEPQPRARHSYQPLLASSPESSKCIPAPFWLRPGTLVRREIRNLSQSERERFVRALQRLMANKESGKSQTGFFRIAACHGWPLDLGHYEMETFPSWNRGHLVELERALNAADKELGNNGRLGLPYWDWSRPLVNGEVLPRLLREHFGALPEQMVENPRAVGLLAKFGYSKLHSDLQVRLSLEASRVAADAERLPSIGTHWRVSSLGGQHRGPSLESVHDNVQLSCGFPLSDPSFAAFHPLFFLNRCNIDRLYELHLQMFDPVESCGAMEQHQKQLSENEGGPDAFRLPLDPLMHPLEMRPLIPADTFVAQDLGYVYDELPPEPLVEQPRSKAQEEPVYAAFKGIDTCSLHGSCQHCCGSYSSGGCSGAGRSYMLHVFVLPQHAAASWRPPHGGPEAWFEDTAYAGCHALLGRPSSRDSTRRRQTINVLVEVQQVLAQQRLSWHKAGLRVMCTDQIGGISTLEETPIPAPVLVGPLFEDPTGTLKHGSNGGEVQQLQERLRKLGFHPGRADGNFGSQTEEAVRLFQKFNVLKEDGMAGRFTKQWLAKPRNDLLPDVASSTPRCSAVSKGSTVRYQVLTLPQHLELRRDRTLADVGLAFRQWGEAAGVFFACVEHSWRADLTVRFADLSSHGADFHGGLAVPRGQLCEITNHEIRLDAGEYWLLEREEVPLRRPHAVRLYPVLLHAVGHLLGLPHSSSPQDVMWPYYRAEDGVTLSANDIAMVRAKVGESGGCHHQ